MDHSVPRKIFEEALEYEDRVSLYEPEGVDALVRDMRNDEKLAWAVKQRVIWRKRVLAWLKTRFDMNEPEYKELCMKHGGKCAYCGRIPGGSHQVSDASFLQPSYRDRTVLYCTSCRFALEGRG